MRPDAVSTTLPELRTRSADARHNDQTGAYVSCKIALQNEDNFLRRCADICGNTPMQLSQRAWLARHRIAQHLRT
jgi:hypothetical protein